MENGAKKGNRTGGNRGKGKGDGERRPPSGHEIFLQLPFEFAKQPSRVGFDSTGGAESACTSGREKTKIRNQDQEERAVTAAAGAAEQKADSLDTEEHNSVFRFRLEFSCLFASVGGSE